MLKEFKKFISKGNVVDLTVDVIIGGAFGKIVNNPPSLTKDEKENKIKYKGILLIFHVISLLLFYKIY